MGKAETNQTENCRQCQPDSKLKACKTLRLCILAEPKISVRASTAASRSKDLAFAAAVDMQK